MYCRAYRNKKDFYVEQSKSSLSTRFVHKSKEKYFYKLKSGMLYKKHEVDLGDIGIFI